MKGNLQVGSVRLLALALATASLPTGHAQSQSTLTPWGNLAGFWVAHQPVDFEAGLRLVHRDWTGFSSAVKYLQRPRYSRSGSQASVESNIEGITFKKVVTDLGPGEARIKVECTAKTNLPLAGLFYCLDLPDLEFVGGNLAVIPPDTLGEPGLTLTSGLPGQSGECLYRANATGVKIDAPQHTLEIRWDYPRPLRLRREASNRPTSLNDPSIQQHFLTNGASAKPASYQVYLELFSGDAAPGRSARISLTLRASVLPDLRPVHLVLDPAKPGRPFDGIGGNFRLQFPKTDGAVIQYNLDHLPLAWGRFDLAWPEWDPEEETDPLVAARTGRIHPKIADAIDTARTLAQREIPLMVGVWTPPMWARFPGPQPVGLRGTALDTNKLDRICASLTSYLVFLKEHAGLQVACFSFNEPETGVEVRQTPAEHVQFIRAMGPHLARAGLTTKLLLGDTAHGTPAALEFIRPALADPATHPYIGAIAFHTWRGCTAEGLPAWADAARLLGVPLMVTEAGPDAHLHEYPSVRLEPWFQLQEIELYLRICALAQPATIMEWQLTTDYSVLTGGGIYGEDGPMKPTQRFWNLKQLGATPPHAFALPLSADRPEITAAAFGNLLQGRYALHLVNRGAARRAILSGLPATLSTLRPFITDATRGMEEADSIPVRGRQAEFILPPASYTTLLN